MRRVLILAAAIVVLASTAAAPTVHAVDLEPGECYQHTQYTANSCGGQSYVTYETCMDEFGQLHTEVIAVGSWCQ